MQLGIDISPYTHWMSIRVPYIKENPWLRDLQLCLQWQGTPC
jgi:hypothetical protein